MSIETVKATVGLSRRLRVDRKKAHLNKELE